MASTAFLTQHGRCKIYLGLGTSSALSAQHHRVLFLRSTFEHSRGCSTQEASQTILL